MGRGAGSPTAPRRVCRIRGATREAVSPLVLRGRVSLGTVPNISRGGEYLPHTPIKLITLTRFLALEHAKDNIQVNCVAPGPHDTPMWRALDEKRRTAILATVPSTEAPGDPDRLAGLIQFLCEPDATYITGATIDINGGQWMG